MKHKTIAGIDLGTTYSALAVLNPLGKPEIVPNLAGDRLTPSVVYFPEGEPELVQVGSEAKKMAKTDGHRLVQFVKRSMGRPSHRYTFDDREWSPTEISSLILKKLKSECIQEGEINEAVITVPAHFDEVQRKCTMDAGKLAGLEVLGIINEPTAAALYYASLEKIEGKVMIYDLGGGTFDVTVLEITGRDVNILTSKGNGLLGGVDFDLEIVRMYSEAHQQRFGVPLLPAEVLEHHNEDIPPEHLSDLLNRLELAEKDKRTLSIRPNAKRAISSDHGNLSVTISREQFEAAISPFVANTEMLVEAALEDAEVSASDLDTVVLVGGSTRIPKFVQSLEKLIGKPVHKAVNVDEAVALGAALSAGMKLNELNPSHVAPKTKKELAKTELYDVSNHYFGVIALSFDEAVGRDSLRNCIVLEKNQTLPCTRTDTFNTVVENQKIWSVRVTQTAENEPDPEYARQIGKFELPIPPGCPKGTPVEVLYTYDTNQILHCEFTTSDGVTHKAKITYAEDGMLTQSELEREKVKLDEFQVE